MSAWVKSSHSTTDRADRTCESETVLYHSLVVPNLAEQPDKQFHNRSLCEPHPAAPARQFSAEVGVEYSQIRVMGRLPRHDLFNMQGARITSSGIKFSLRVSFDGQNSRIENVTSGLAASSMESSASFMRDEGLTDRAQNNSSRSS